jgi:hypothetical protein
MSNGLDQKGLSQKLGALDNKLRKNYSTQKEMGGDTESCSKNSPSSAKSEAAEREKRYYHVGLRLCISQYKIAGRNMKLELPMRPNESLKKNDNFYQLKGSPFSPAQECSDMPKPKELYSIGSDPHNPDHYEADLVCSTQLIAEDGLEGYQKGGKQGDLNDFLGRAIGLNISRSNTFRVTSTGNFYAKNLDRVKDLAETEKLCVKIYTFLKTKIDSKIDKVYEIVNGEIADIIGPTEYNQRKLCKIKSHSDKEGGKMPFIPGVYQIHILIEGSSEGYFELKEVYCDGDRIYPE